MGNFTDSFLRNNDCVREAHLAQQRQWVVDKHQQTLAAQALNSGGVFGNTITAGSLTTDGSGGIFANPNVVHVGSDSISFDRVQGYQPEGLNFARQGPETALEWLDRRIVEMRVKARGFCRPVAEGERIFA